MRKPLDAYYTPESAVRDLRLAMQGNFTKHQRFFEPCVGTGNIIKGFQTELQQCHAIIPQSSWKTGDIDPSVKPDYVGDAKDSKVWEALKQDTKFIPDWTITNPPFDGAFEILKNARKYSKEGVILLLRLSFLEPTYERGEYLQTHPPNKVIVLPRISFTGDGKTDSVTCAWMFWSQLNFSSSVSIVSKGTKK